MYNIPKKSLGQHWLKDENTLNGIVEFAALNPEDKVLEIGPGEGDLTRKILPKVQKVIAVEKDEKLAAKLKKEAQSNLEVIPVDILKFDLTQLPRGYKVVANIPYYLTSNLLRVLCESPNPPSLMVLLVQKEVAERIAAKPGLMSVLSVSVQFYCEVELGKVVPSHLFIPPPKVDSQIIKLTYRDLALFNVNTKEFFRIVKAGFANRRKTLLNSVSAGMSISKDKTQELLKSAGINPQTRAQQLSLDDWYKLYKIF